jgi:predicted nucleic acid-binding protein
MNLVADASVGAKWLFRESDSTIARRVLESWIAGSLDLRAPGIQAAETAPSIWKRVIREGSRKERRSSFMLDSWSTFDPIADLVEPLPLATRHRHPIYDCLYVARAMETESELLTGRRKALSCVPAP